MKPSKPYWFVSALVPIYSKKKGKPFRFYIDTTSLFWLFLRVNWALFRMRRAPAFELSVGKRTGMWSDYHAPPLEATIPQVPAEHPPPEEESTSHLPI